jgi:RNA-binding protein YlmH
MTKAAVEVGDVIVERDVALEAVMEEAIDFKYAGLEAVGKDDVGFEAVSKEAVGLEAVGLEAVGLEAVRLEAVRLEAVGLEAVDFEAIATTVDEVLEAGVVGSFEQIKRCLASLACDLKK